MLLVVDGLEIRTLRLARGVTQKACCERAGVSLKTLQRMEQGLTATPRSVRAVARALEVEPKTLARPKERRVSLRVVA